MFDRKQLKEYGKRAFKSNYWPCVIAALILSIAVTGIASFNGYNAQSTTSQDQSTITFVAAVSISAISLLGYLMLKPLETGGKSFFLKNSDGNASLSEFAKGYKENFFNGVLTYFLRDLFIALWGLLLIVPGIMKAYSYRMVPYILAENPTIGAKEALDRSAKMMDGYRMEAFKLDLSFIGWYIVGILTFGLGVALYANPYRFATDAELYKEIRNRA